jgi:hypothetical protein
LLDATCNAIAIPKIQVQPLSNGGPRNFFQVVPSLSSLLEGQSPGEHLCLALQDLQGADTALWQRELDFTSLRTLELSVAKLWCDSITKLTIHF